MTPGKSSVALSLFMARCLADWVLPLLASLRLTDASASRRPMQALLQCCVDCSRPRPARPLLSCQLATRLVLPSRLFKVEELLCGEVEWLISTPVLCWVFVYERRLSKAQTNSHYNGKRDHCMTVRFWDADVRCMY